MTPPSKPQSDKPQSDKPQSDKPQSDKPAPATKSDEPKRAKSHASEVGRILVVDDDRAVRSALRINLSKAGWDVTLVDNGEQAMDALRQRPFDVVLTDVMMPVMTGMELLPQVRRCWSDTRIVVMTGHGSVQDAVASLKAGADDYVIKPVGRDELLVVLSKALREKALRAEVVQLRAELDERYGFQNLVGATPAMEHVYELVSAVADSDALVLLSGPTGTGKELLAHAIHRRSPRRNAAYVRVNCAALPEGLLESELFGHEKGAFTGATRLHLGRFEQADGGTILLDEIGEIPLSTQVKLLRVLQEGEIQRLGSTRVRTIDVRVVAATNRDLRQEVRAGRFREDLYYRLNVFNIAVPSLAERRADIPLLTEHFLKIFTERFGRPIERVSSDVMQQLLAHNWPGNVRELEHTIERAVLLCRGTVLERIQLPELDLDDLDGDKDAHGDNLLPAGCSLPEALADRERAIIIDALQQDGGVQARAARRMGISRSNLNYRINKLGISVREITYD